MNEKTFNELFLKWSFLYATMRYRILETQLQTFEYWDNSVPTWEFRGEKYLNTFIVTNVNDCPNLLSYGATFRMGVLLPNYPEENIVEGENVPNSGCQLDFVKKKKRVFFKRFNYQKTKRFL